MLERSEITGIILCGGRGSRLDGLDKPLIELGRKRIVDYIIASLHKQVGRIVISCSRNVALYEALQQGVVVDSEPGRGPLAGIYETFAAVSTEWVLTTPGDVPFLPDSLVMRLQNDALAQGIAVPSVNGQRQNLCLLLNRSKREELSAFYKKGGSAVKHWLNDNGVASTDLSELAVGFADVNTSNDLERAKSRLKSMGP